MKNRTIPADEKSPRQASPASSSNTPPSSTQVPPTRPSQLCPPTIAPSYSWLSLLPFTSSRTSKQVRQTILSLVRDLVLNTHSPSADILSSCASACKSHSLSFSALLQEPSIEDHSAIYWAIVNRKDDEELLKALIGHAAPLSQASVSDVRLACLATSNQGLFQALRCRREPFEKEKAPLSTSSGAFLGRNTRIYGGF